MKATDQQLDMGTHVYASLGHMTVKAGRVNGMRTEVKGNERPSLAYWVLWFGAGDRKDQAEWIESRHVHLSPNAAFDIPDVAIKEPLSDEQWQRIADITRVFITREMKDAFI